MGLDPSGLAAPAAGFLTFGTFEVAFWRGEQLAWLGGGSPPAAPQQYLAKANAYGYGGNLFLGGCARGESDTLPKYYLGMKALASFGKPAFPWVFLTGAPSYCHAGVLTGSEATAQINTGFAAGADAAAFWTSTRPPSAGGVFAVRPTVEMAVKQALVQLVTLAPCFLVGQNVPVATSSANVAARACRYGGQLYIRAINLSDKQTVKAGLRVGVKAGTAVALWEERSLKMPATGIVDSFQPLATHTYRVQFGEPTRTAPSGGRSLPAL